MTFKEKLRRLTDFINGTADEHIGAFAAQTAFFIFLSFFPMVSLMMSLSRFLPITQEQLIELICNVIPGRFEDYVITIVNDIYSGGTNTMTIVSAVLALWSAAKGLMAIRLGLNEVYRSREQRNYLIIRGISSVYTALFLVMLVIMIPINMFGTQIVLFVINKFPSFDNIAMLLFGLRTAATLIILFLFFWLLYTIVPNRRLRFSRQIPGAAFTAVSWVVITKIISLFIDQFLSNSYMYGSLTMVILMMMWLYFVSNMIFVGAQINEYLYLVKYKDEDAEIDRKKAEAKEKRKREKERKRQQKQEKQEVNSKDAVNHTGKEELSSSESVNPTDNEESLSTEALNPTDNEELLSKDAENHTGDGEKSTSVAEQNTVDNTDNAEIGKSAVVLDFIKKMKEKKVKKVSDDDDFVNDEISGE